MFFLNSLSISSSPIERVSSFHYLGVLLSSNLSWAPHISSIFCKSHRILGLIFRHFHPHSSPSTIIRLYVSLVRPHLEYCSAIWAPSSPSLCRRINSVQLFGLKLASKFCPSIQSCFNLPSLSSRRLHSNLILIFKIHHNLLHFPLHVLHLNLLRVLLTPSAIFTNITSSNPSQERLPSQIPSFPPPSLSGTPFLLLQKKLLFKSIMYVKDLYVNVLCALCISLMEFSPIKNICSGWCIRLCRLQCLILLSF